MTTVAILPETTADNGIQYRAVCNGNQRAGKSAGEALDALTATLDPSEAGTLVVIQAFHVTHRKLCSICLSRSSILFHLIAEGTTTNRTSDSRVARAICTSRTRLRRPIPRQA